MRLETNNTVLTGLIFRFIAPFTLFGFMGYTFYGQIAKGADLLEIVVFGLVKLFLTFAVVLEVLR